jgi:DNA uptake protein ComE-like DNA-binding protein
VRKKVEPFDINTADTSAFIALPGIGSKLASRIVLFREKLGGFYDVRQIGEVYGLQDSIFRKISPMLKCDPNAVTKIDINNAEREALRMHPYIRWQLANALVAYRDQHGSFHSADDIAKLDNVDAEAVKKMMPYISFK